MLDKINYKFSKFNPYIVFTYFILLFVLVFSKKSFTLSLISFLSIIVVAIVYVPFSEINKNKYFILFLFFMPIIFNKLFIHSNSNILSTSFLITSFYITFLYFNVFLDDSKIFYMFYKTLPKTALVLSISIRYYYVIINKYKLISECFNANNVEKKSFLSKFSNASDVFLSLTGQTLEDGIILSKSIKSKGYMSKKRTYYSDSCSPIKFKDVVMFLIICLLFFITFHFKINICFVLFLFLPVVTDGIYNFWRFLKWH